MGQRDLLRHIFDKLGQIQLFPEQYQVEDNLDIKEPPDNTTLD